MSLSEDVLQGRFQGVQTRLERGESPNIIDEYGYTPLVHAIVTQNLEIVKLLLKHHANLDILDNSGLTALHWAVDMDNYDIVKALLGFRANPNAYSSSGQPILFYPLLRHDKPLIQLLIDHGADLHFAKDFILAKLIGHRFELRGACDIVNSEGLFLEVDMEGFYLEFTLDIISDSLKHFINSFVAKRMNIYEEELHIILQAFKHAMKLREYKHISKSIEENKSIIYKLTEIDLLLLPVSFVGHAITFIKHGNLFAKCDRGVHKMTDPIVINVIKNPRPLTSGFYSNLLYKRHTRKYIQKDIYQILNLEPYVKLPIKHQVTGNCSWANVEASVPTMLYMLLHDKLKNKAEANKLVIEIMRFYFAWLSWDKDRALEDLFLDFDKLSINRKKARAALMGEILFQACNPNKKNDLKRAKKILTMLSRPEYHFIIRSYLNVFGSTSRSQGAVFTQILRDCGYQPADFNR